MNISVKTRQKFLYPFWNCFASLFPVTATKIKYRLTTGKWLNLIKPETINEKIQWLKLYTYRFSPLVKQCCDKFAVRQYVYDLGCGEILNEIYGKWENPTDIDWDALPNKFVLKCNHGSGQNIICENKNCFDKDKAIKNLTDWLKEDYGKTNVELIYEGIPRCVIAEKFIETDDGLPPKDYKIFCSYGKPKLLFVASDRKGDFARFDYYTPEWEWIPVRNNHPNGGRIEKPPFLPLMLNYAERLAKPFPIVRVDFYYENQKLIFGELTFLHFGGSAPFDPPSYEKTFGDLFDISRELNMGNTPRKHSS